jgi:tetratricopeptide (TPR) repeat protein
VNKVKLLFRIAILLWLIDAAIISASQTNELSNLNETLVALDVPRNRTSLAILALENKTGDEIAYPLGLALTTSVIVHLKEIKALHILSSSDFALLQLNLTNNNLDNVQARQLGKLMGAQWLVWGSYEYDKARNWTVIIQVIDVAAKQETCTARFVSTNLVNIQDWIISQVLKDINIKPTQTEQQNMNRCWTKSPEAFEYYGRSMGEQKLTNQEPYLRKTIEKDPQFADAKATLATVLGFQNRINEAQSNIIEAVYLQPSSAFVYKANSLILLLQQRTSAAEKNLQIAAQLDPDDAETFERLGDVYFSKDQQSLALENYRKALLLDPFAPFVKYLQDQIEYLKPRQTPTYITNWPPKSYTEQTLKEALCKKLNSDQLAFVINPLAISPEMKMWTLEATKGATNDMQKAKILFEILVNQINKNNSRVSYSATAKEVFSDLNKPDIPLYCQQATFLFVALARSIGIKSFVVDVQESCNGNKSSHLCGVIFADNHALLVDPVYRWFGVPHRNFVLLDDLQTIAMYCSTLPDVKQKQIAWELAPDLALVQYNLCLWFIGLDRWEKVRELFPLLTKSDRNAVMADSVQAFLMMHANYSEQAIKLLHKAIEIDSERSAKVFSKGPKLCTYNRG